GGAGGSGGVGGGGAGGGGSGVGDGPGGGGTSVDFQLRLVQGSDEYHGSSNWVTNSFTPTAGARIVVLNSMIIEASGSFGSSLTISDSQGLTWTSIGYVDESSYWAITTRAWISSPAANTSMTLSLGAGGNNVFEYRVIAFEVTNSDGQFGGFVVDNNLPNDGPASMTLTSNPPTGSLGVFSRFQDEGGSGLTMDTGWEYLDSVGTPSGYHWKAAAVRPNIPDTSVSILDIMVNQEGSLYKTIGLAFYVTPAGANDGGPGDPGDPSP
ncbi:MAG TPA: hypothetical protein PKD79_04100, partial [Candidatus Doudnabacteria bacterium]|nr:hypothetical protein [Candidatus Doudnabacteria bacterium]